MSRVKLLVPLVVLALSLLWPLAAAAADFDPSTCLELDGKCYAANEVLDDTNTATKADGTAMAPWLVITDEELDDVYAAVSEAVWSSYGNGYLALIICDAGGCQTTWYRFFYEDGKQKTTQWTDPGVPPEVGVDLPVPYILAGGALLGVLLVGTGIILRRKAQRLAS